MIIFGLATRKIETLSHIKVIGITGSYGKSSTKSMIAQLLRSTFDVEETLENQNTTIGIASTIVRRLTPSTDIFVMEVGAYKIGEIRDSVSLVGQRLENAVITGVNEQHLQLFGSKERIEEAKYELIENLPQGKTVYVNADNPVAKRMGERAKKEGRKVVTYGFSSSCDIYATDIKDTQRGITCTVHFKEYTSTLSLPLFGRHNVENLLCALVVCFKTGVPWAVLMKEASSLTLPAHSMHVFRVGKTTCLDDTYSANSDGVIAALNSLGKYKGERILVLHPLIELGDASDEVHKRIGTVAAQVCNVIVMTNDSFVESVSNGTRKGDTSIPVLVKRGKEAYLYLEGTFPDTKTILFEGREARNILQYYG